MMAWPLVPLGKIVQPAERWEAPLTGVRYRQLGVRLWGEGAYEREPMDGSETKYAKLNRVQTGDLVVNKIWARNGSVAVVQSSLCGCYVSGEFPTFSPISSRVDSLWLHWITKTKPFWEQCDERSRGTSGKNRIRPEQFLSLVVPLPPLNEQQRIVKRIETVHAKIQIVDNLATDVEMATRMTWMVLAHELLENIPRGDRRPLGELVTLVGGGTPSKGNPEYWHGKIPWVSPKDMKTRIIRDSADHISDSAVNGSAAKLIPPGAVLIVVRGMILAHTVPSAVLAVPATINQDMKALIPLGGLAPEFLSMYLWAFNRELLALVERSTHDTRKLETGKLLEFPVVVPPMETQDAVCRELRRLEERVSVLSEQRHMAQAQIKALMPSILNHAFSGQL